MWTKPWKLKEGFLIGGGLLILGILLQVVAGPFPWDRMVFPVNLITLAVFLGLIGMMYALRRKVFLFEWMMYVQAAVPAMSYALGLTIIMGLVAQHDDGGGIPWLSRMLDFWPFVMVYTWMMVILGLSVLGRLLRFSWKEIPFLLNHLGLFLALVCGALGAADTQRMYMTTREGETEWFAEDGNGDRHELDIAIELHDFIMEEFPMQPGARMRVPKRFASEVTVHTKSGETVDSVIEVNKSLKVSGWKIYQYSYDSEAGVESTVSIFEMVRDPWQPFVLTGILMMIAGAVCLFLLLAPKTDK